MLLVVGRCADLWSFPEEMERKFRWGAAYAFQLRPAFDLLQAGLDCLLVCSFLDCVGDVNDVRPNDGVASLFREFTF
jgi:hypothetical protein